MRSFFHGLALLGALLPTNAARAESARYALSGPASFITGQCVAIQLKRSGPIDFPSLAELRGWGMKLALFTAKDCSGAPYHPGSYVMFQSRIDTLTFYASGYALPGSQESHALIASDPSRRYTEASLSLVVEPSSLAIKGPGSFITGECKEISVERIGDYGNRAALFLLDGWGANLGVFFDSECRTRPVFKHSYQSFATGQTSFKLYVTGYSLVASGVREAITASDPLRLLKSGSIEFLIRPPSLVMEGNGSFITGECKPITISRVGSFLPLPESVELNGWTNLFGLFKGSDCRQNPVRLREWISFAPGQASIRLYMSGAAFPAARAETIRAVDPTHRLAEGSLLVTVRPPALVLAGPESFQAGQCAEVTVTRVGADLRMPGDLRLSGMGPYFAASEGSGCRGPFVSNYSWLRFAAGQATIVVSVIGWTPDGSPRTVLLGASDPMGRLESGSLKRTIHPIGH